MKTKQLKSLKATLSNESGRGLLEITIVISLMTPIMMTVFQMYQQGIQVYNIHNHTINQAQLRSFINTLIDCSETLNRLEGKCDTGDEIALHVGKKKSQKSKKYYFDTSLIKIGNGNFHKYTTIGRYQIRSVCSKEQKITIEKRRILKSRNKALDEWSPLYKNEFKCSLHSDESYAEKKKLL